MKFEFDYLDKFDRFYVSHYKLSLISKVKQVELKKVQEDWVRMTYLNLYPKICYE